MPTWNGGAAVLHEPLDSPGPRRRWRAEVGGRRAIAVEAELRSPRDAAMAGQRLKRLAQHPDPALPPVYAWAVEGSSAWAVTSEAGGRALQDLVREGPLRPAEAAAVVWAVLGAVETFHEAGLAHGEVAAERVRVDPDGFVHLEGGWFTPEARGSADELVADVEGAGRIGLVALGIGLHATGSPTEAETAAPALTRMIRAIASGASGSRVAGARMALAATAGPLVEPAALSAAREALGRRVRGESARAAPPPAAASVPPAPRPVPGPAPVPERTAARPAARPPASSAAPARRAAPRPYVATAADFERAPGAVPWDRIAVPLIAVGILLLVLAMGWIGVQALTRRASPAAAPARPAATRPTVATSTASPTATPAPTTPTPTPSPSFGPAAAAPVRSVAMTLSGCGPGASCSAEIVVSTERAPAANDVSWTVRAYDSCTGTTSDVGSGHFTENAGWTSIDVTQPIRLPASRGQLLVAAVTGAPAAAASPPVAVGQAAC